MGASAGAIKAGRAYVEIFGDTAPLMKTLKSVEGRLKDFGAKIAGIGTTLLTAGAAGLTAFAGAAGLFTSTASAVNDMAERTGVGTEKIQELAMAAKLAGASSEDLEAGLKTMEKTIVEAASGSKSAADALAKVGLSAGQLAGLTPDQQLNAIADGLAAIGDPGQRAAAAMDVLGKAGFKLGPAMKGGSAGLAALGAEARRLGLVTSAADVALGDELGDTLDTLKAVLSQVAVNIGAAVAPAIIQMAKAATEVIAGMAKWIEQNREIVVTIAKVTAVVAAVGAGLVAIGGAAMLVASAISAFGTIVAAVSAAIPVLSAVLGAILSPIGLVVVAVTAAAAAFLYFSGIGEMICGQIMGVFSDMWEAVKPVFDGIVNALMSGRFQLAGEIAWKGLQVAFRAGIHEVNRMWESFWAGIYDIAAAAAQGLADVIKQLTGQEINFNIVGTKAERDKARAGREAGTLKARDDAMAGLKAALAEAAVKPDANDPQPDVGDNPAAPVVPNKNTRWRELDMSRVGEVKGTFSAREASGLGNNGVHATMKSMLIMEQRMVELLTGIKKQGDGAARFI